MNYRRWFHIIFVLAVILSLPLTSITISTVQAGNLVVNTLEDVSIGNCTTTCSLRDAITVASSGDTITFSVIGTITLGSMIDILKDLTINGPGPTQLNITAPYPNRVFSIRASVTLSGISIRNNASPFTPVYIDSVGTLTLENSLFDSNFGNSGSAIVNSGILNISNSVFTNNGACAGAGTCSALNIPVIFNDTGSITVTDSLFEGNTSSAIRNHIDTVFSRSTTIQVTRCIFRNNSSVVGAAIHSENRGFVYVTDSLFDGNTALVASAIWITGARGVISGSLFVNNRSTASETDIHGGTIAVSGIFAIANTTLTGNSSAGRGGAILAIGPSQVDIVNTTIADNNSPFGGAIAHVDASSEIVGITLKNTIIANNTAVGENCFGGAINDGGNNIQFGGDTLSCGESIRYADPKLAALATNGGFTQTRALLTGSPAIDSGNNAVCSAEPVNNVDQRGVNRMQGLACDIGAYETSLTATQTPPGPTLTPTATPFVSPRIWVVNTTDDLQHGTCATICTLRDALLLSSSGDRIEFAVSSPILRITQGTLVLTKPVTIDGGGTIQLEMLSYLPMLQIYGRGATIIGLHIRHGFGGFYEYSSGILLKGGVENSYLTLENCKFSQLTQQTGSHIVLDGRLTNLIATDTEFTGSRQVAIRATMPSSTITLIGGSLRNNVGGIDISEGKVTVIRTRFTNNRGTGGAILASGLGAQVNVTDAYFENNTAVLGGGAISSADTLRIESSTFYNNSSSARGGAIALSGSGDNSVIVNSTFTYNYANQGGGAIALTGAKLNVLNDTFAYNKSSDLEGSNLWVNSAGQLSLFNSILAFSYFIPLTPPAGSNCKIDSDSTLVDGGGNVQYGETAVTTCVGIVANPRLTSLTDNGGLTPTMALLLGSAAIDVGVSSICTGSIVGNIDQRGVTRNIGAGCDSGAYEGSIAAAPPDTIGIYRPSDNTFYLRNSNSTGFADITVSLVGLGMDPNEFRDVPLVGDWNGDGIDTIGFFRRGRASDGAGGGLFVLADSNITPQTNYYFILGNPGDTPIVGDWDGDGKDGVGVFRPSNGLIYIKNNLTTGFADYTMVLGNPGDVGIAGDWDNDGRDSPGVYRPGAAPQFYLTNQVCNCVVASDYNVTFGNPGDQPFTGDWNGDGRTGLGIYRTSNGITYLRNDPTTTGFSDFNFVYGVNGDYAFGGVWAAATPPAQIEIAPPFQP